LAFDEWKQLLKHYPLNITCSRYTLIMWQSNIFRNKIPPLLDWFSWCLKAKSHFKQALSVAEFRPIDNAKPSLIGLFHKEVKAPLCQCPSSYFPHFPNYVYMAWALKTHIEGMIFILPSTAQTSASTAHMHDFPHSTRATVSACHHVSHSIFLWSRDTNFEFRFCESQLQIALWGFSVSTHRSFDSMSC